jgi:hypothetical protein
MTLLRSWLNFLLRRSHSAIKPKANPSRGPRLKPRPVRPVRMNPPQDVEEL